MITHLHITDLGVIAGANVEFSPGFTAVTGETGAGKTMVITALGLVLGERAEQSAVRAGAQRAIAEAVFDVSGAPEAKHTARDLDAEIDDDELIVSRRVNQDGRSRATVGGRAVPIGALGELGHQLVAIHGQNDQIRLASAQAQCELIDNYAGNAELLARYRNAFDRRRAAQAKLRDFDEGRQERLARAEQLRSDLEAIARVSPVSGEDAELEQRITRLSHAEAIREAVALAATALADDTGEIPDAIGLVETARKSTEQAASMDSTLDAVATALRDARYALEEASSELTRYADDFDSAGPEALAQAQDRLAELRKLCRAYGPTLDDVLAFDTAGIAELTELEADDDTGARLRAILEQAETELAALAAQLTQTRTAAAQELTQRATAELAALAMPHAVLHAEVSPLGEYSATGRDRVEFLLSSQPGQQPRSLLKGASGGELSRIMLAIEVVVAAKDSVPTYIFDEVDAGIGGAAAIEVGKRLARLARHAQVIVVTHLAQVASFAHQHLVVHKDSDGQYTESSVRVVAGAQRDRELARMLSGLDTSPTALAHARELLEMARAINAE